MLQQDHSSAKSQLRDLCTFPPLLVKAVWIQKFEYSDTQGGGLPLLKGEEEGRMGGGSVLLGAERRRGADIEM